jgi:starch synthase
VWSLPNLCKNFYYALPNKIFEYLVAGLPIVGADFPEVRRIVNRYEVGLCFDPYDPKSIARQINRMVENPDLIRKFRQNATAALIDMHADREWQQLADLYKRLLPARIQ